MKPVPTLTFSTLLLILCSQISYSQVAADPSLEGYQLVWSDEFSENGAVNVGKWHHQTQLPNGYSWYNGEEQHYTDELANSHVENGVLKITAIKEQYTDQGHTKPYTSARLNSKFAFTYGRVEVRAKLPSGKGTWPAIWMLGQNILERGGYWTPTHGTTSWPACGEIDIMEHWGVDRQNQISAAIHTPSSYGGTVNKGTIEPRNDVGSTFHIYSMEWDEAKIKFYLDGTNYYTYEPGTKNSQTWPFDKPQYILLNIAMGGIYSIDPNFTSSSMEIDYVRVYQLSESLTPQVAAPTPALEQEDVISFFSDAFTDINVDKWLADWSVGTVQDVSLADNPTKKYENVSYVGIETTSNPVDLTEMTHFHMDFWTTDATMLKIKLVDFGANKLYDGAAGDDSESEIIFDAPAQGEWISYDLPIADFADLNDRTSLAQIVLSSTPTEASSFYIDNLYFHREPNEPEPVLATIPDDQLSILRSGDLLTIKFKNPTRVLKYQVYDLSGRIYSNDEVDTSAGQDLQIPISGTGIRILKISTNKGMFIQKIAI